MLHFFPLYTPCACRECGVGRLGFPGRRRGDQTHPATMSSREGLSSFGLSRYPASLSCVSIFLGAEDMIWIAAFMKMSWKQWYGSEHRPSLVIATAAHCDTSVTHTLLFLLKDVRCAQIVKANSWLSLLKTFGKAVYLGSHSPEEWGLALPQQKKEVWSWFSQTGRQDLAKSSFFPSNFAVPTLSFPNLFTCKVFFTLYCVAVHSFMVLTIITY